MALVDETHKIFFYDFTTAIAAMLVLVGAIYSNSIALLAGAGWVMLASMRSSALASSGATSSHH